VRTARRIVDILEKRSDRPMRFELAAQVIHQALDLAEDDGDGPRVWRLGDARGFIGLGCARGDTNELPGRREAPHDQHEPVEEHVGLGDAGPALCLLRDRRFQQ
jgi:hypothetical protein